MLNSLFQASDSKSVSRRAVLLVILAVAAFFRLYRLEAIPPGLTHDEADTGYFVASVYRGTPSTVDVPYGYAYKPFTKYSGALFMALFGPTDLALRLHSAFFGTILVLFTYLWSREAFGGTVALGSSALMAVSFWPVCDSRFALNSAPAPALFTASTYFLWLALGNEEPRRAWWAWGAFALLLGASLYVYEAALAAAASLVLLLLHLALVDATRFRRHRIWFAGALAVAALLAAPHLLSPSSWGRTNTLSGPLQAASQGNLAPLLNNAIGALGTFSFRGDTLVTYNLPGRPIFDPITSVFFYAGLVVCLWRWRQATHAFVLMWLVAGIAPSLIIGQWTSTLHSKAAEAAIMALPAIGAVEIGRLIDRRFGIRWARLFAVGCIIWLVVVAGMTGYDYFVRWGQDPDTRAAYFSNLAAITDYLNVSEYSGVVTLSSPFPDLPHDPFIARLRLHRQDLSLRWFDARRALVFPDTPRSLLILPPNTPLAPSFTGRLDLRLIERIQLYPDDVDPYFDVFEWHPTTVRSEFLGSVSRTASAGGDTLKLPVNVGDAVEFLGYDLELESGAAGEVASLVTFWRVLESFEAASDHPLGRVPSTAYGHRATIFAHVLDESDRLVAQEDRLDAPAWNWHAGDVLAQSHRIELPADAQAGIYSLRVGIYNNNEGELRRLPILVDVDPVDDSLVLCSLEVGAR